MKKNIFIFLNDKLISLDTIVPILLELKSVNSELNLNFFVFKQKTLNTIKSNFFLYNITKELGNISRFGPESLDSFSFLRRLSACLLLLKLMIQGLFQKNVYIHFKALEDFPFSLLYYTNQKNTYLFEANPLGQSKSFTKMRNIFNELPVNYEDFGHRKSMSAYSNLVSFSEDSFQLKSAKSLRKNILYLEPPRSGKKWLDFCTLKSKDFLSKHLELREKTKTKKIILYLLGELGHFAFVDNQTNGKMLFLETLASLRKIENAFIIIKPHPNVDLEELANLVQDSKMSNIEISLMHPSVLANYCQFAISNYFTFSLADAWLAGVHTIEFSSYRPELSRELKNTSIYPEYVDDFLQLTERDNFIKILNSNSKPKYRNFHAKIPRNDYQKLIDLIVN
ncbi:hypothetical protein N9I90_03885 [Alphaproteobacteria bacterium]|nr:hypothetical protein [Alphaproteobacteria bacterium]